MIKLVSTVGFIIINQENKVLLIKHCKENEKEEIEKDDKLILPKKEKEEVVEEEWMIPFSTVEEDDNLRDVLRKEVKKCLNCEINDCNYFNLYFYNISDSFIKKVSYFYGTIVGEAKTKNGTKSIEWVSLEKKEINRLSLMSEQKEVLNNFIDFFQDKFLEKME